MIWNLLEGTETPVVSYVVMAVLVIAIIGLFVWQSITNKKRQKEAQDMVSSLKIGDKVKTIGGICGYVAQINDAENTFVLETGLEGNKSYVKFDKGAIYQTAPANGTQTVEEVKEEKVEEAPVEVATEEKPAPKKRTTKKKAE